LTGSSVFITASNYGIGKSVTVEISGSSSVSNIYFPSVWQFFPSITSTSTIPINGIGLLALKSGGTTDSNIRGVFVTTGANLSASFAITSSYSSNTNSASYALNSSTASFVTASNIIGIVTSSSYALTSSNVTGKSNCSEYKVSSGFINYYSSSITASNNDDGHTICMITGSLIYLTGSLSTTFTTLIYQSGSSTITITGSDSSVVIRNRQGFKAIAGQYGVASILRMNNGDFVLSGDLA
jgi:hypothetical protein